MSSRLFRFWAGGYIAANVVGIPVLVTALVIHGYALNAVVWLLVWLLSCYVGWSMWKRWPR